MATFWVDEMACMFWFLVVVVLDWTTRETLKGDPAAIALVAKEATHKSCNPFMVVNIKNSDYKEKITKTGARSRACVNADG
jgi:hypothetical protein